MFGTNTFGSAYFGQGPIGIVVIVLFGPGIIVATLLSGNPGLTVQSLDSAYYAAGHASDYSVEDSNAVLVVADNNGARLATFKG